MKTIRTITIPAALAVALAGSAAADVLPSPEDFITDHAGIYRLSLSASPQTACTIVLLPDRTDETDWQYKTEVEAACAQLVPELAGDWNVTWSVDLSHRGVIGFTLLTARVNEYDAIRFEPAAEVGRYMGSARMGAINLMMERQGT